jgi:diacylglycerol kinase (ATP)
MSTRRTASLLESFNYALEGIIHVLRTHRNMRFHFTAAVIVLVAAVWLGIDRIELAALLISIAFVLIAEMVNSALETAVDMATTTFDPLAKLAKDVAAGAVLIAAVNAVAVGYLVFSHKLGTKASKGLDRLRDQPAEVTAIALIVTILIVIGTKAYTGRGRPLRGGLPSGHAALAFAGWMAATYLIPDERRFLASVITLIMALLVAQTRVEAGFHSALEVAYGGLLGALTTLVIFQVFS